MLILIAPGDPVFVSGKSGGPATVVKQNGSSVSVHMLKTNRKRTVDIGRLSVGFGTRRAEEKPPMKKFSDMSGSDRERTILKLVSDAAEDGVDPDGSTSDLVAILTAVATAALLTREGPPVSTKVQTMNNQYRQKCLVDLEEFLYKNLTEYPYA